MILFTVGTHLPFERLTRVAAHVAAETGEHVVVQGGGGPAERGAEHVGLVPFERLVELVGEARVVVTHAGVGSILTCLRSGCVPIVVPRRWDVCTSLRTVPKPIVRIWLGRDAGN